MPLPRTEYPSCSFLIRIFRLRIFFKTTTVEPSEEKISAVRIVMMESQIMRIFPIADKMQKPKTATKARVIWKYRRLIINGYI